MNFNRRTKSYRSNTKQTLLKNTERRLVIETARIDAIKYLHNENITSNFLFKKHNFSAQYESVYKLVFMLKQTENT